jgi:hypothetical protein
MKIQSFFKPPNPAQQERWQQMKAKGKKSFILRAGIFRFGGFMFVLMTGIDLLRKPPFPREVMDYAFDITINLLIWPLAGYVFGFCMWHFYEKQFSETGSQQDTAHT